MNDLIRKLAEALAEAFRRQVLAQQKDPEAQAEALREINAMVDSQDGQSEELLLDNLLPKARVAADLLEQNPLVRSVAENQKSELLRWGKTDPPNLDEALVLLQRVSNPSPS